MPLVLRQGVVESFGHLGRDVRLTALLAHISHHVLDNQQLLALPDFQRHLAGS